MVDGTVRIADVAVLSTGERLGWGEVTLPAGEYHTIVEVVSEGSEHRDKVEKLQEYAQAGLETYWVVDEHPFRAEDGIIARYGNEGGSFRLRDTVTLSELLTGSG